MEKFSRHFSHIGIQVVQSFIVTQSDLIKYSRVFQKLFLCSVGISMEWI